MLHSDGGMQQCSKMLLLMFLLMLGHIHAVPFYENFMQHLTPPHEHMQLHRLFSPIPLLPSFAPSSEPQTQASQGYPQIRQLVDNKHFHIPHSNFETVDTQFVPLEEQQFQQARTQAPASEEKPFEVDVISGDIGGNRSPSLFFQQSFPFFGQDFLSSFGGFGLGPQQEPWWKGPNVCTDKEETEKKQNNNKENSKPTEEELDTGVSQNVDIKPSVYGQFHFSLNSCVEKPNKYVCSRTVNQNGKMKTIVITRACCHGYGRPHNADYSTPCEKLEIKKIDEAAADMDAKEFVESAKSNGLADQLFTNRKNMTIFMPVDSALANYNELSQSENNMVVKTEDVMKRLYLRHIVDGEYSMHDVASEQILKTQQEGQTIRINLYHMPLSLGPEQHRYTANCVPLVKHDKLAEQGFVNTIDGVLKPVTQTVMDIIRSRADLSIMRTVLEKTKISELLETDKPVTMFVPTDPAFDMLEPHLRRALKEGKACATNILKNHILGLTFCSVASVVGAKTTAYNVLGEPLRFNRSKISQEKSEVADLVGNETVVTINRQSKIIEADIMGTNGVLHIIDTVLSTESALPLSLLMQEKNVTIFKKLVQAAELDYKIDDMNNITLFAPTDKALQGTKWAQMLEESRENLKNNAELVDFINYHIVKPMTKTCDLTEQLMPTVAGSNVRVNLYTTHAFFSNVMNRATVNCARLVHFDDESCGSILHQVDKPLVPPKLNLLQMLESNPSYSKFLELMRAANLSNMLINTEEPYTLLVPKNEVFEEVEDWHKIEKDQNQLESLLKTHIVNDVVCCAGIMPTNWPFIRSIETVNGVHLRITRERRPKIENAGVTKCDTVAVNGIIHEINDIIIPAKRYGKPQHNYFPQNTGSDFGELFF